MEIRRLNTLRGFAVLIVMVAHFSNTLGLWGQVLGYGSGQLGVMLFFLLSGFLMAYLYWEKEPTSHAMLSYAVSRAARVIPLYLLVVFFSFVTPYLYKIQDVRSLISHLLFLYGDSVLWTISPEIQFYILFGFSWLFLWRQRAMLPVVLSFVFLATFLLDYNDWTGEFFGFPFMVSIVRTIQYFILGGIFGGLYKYRQSLLRYQSNWYLFTLALFLMLYPKIFTTLFGFEHALWKDLGILTVIGIVFFCIVFLVPDQNFLLENKAGDFFGKISYSLYLLHMPILILMINIGWAGLGGFSLVAFIILASFIAWVSFHVIEAPSRKALRGMIAEHSVAGEPQLAASADRT
jgi:peptidoglycan/LPS O-acetylase OafA/YrhL